MTHTTHKDQAESLGPIRCAVLTVSDTRTEETDTGGQLIKDLLIQSGNQVSRYRIVKDDAHQVRSAVSEWLSDEQVDAIIVSGSTGVAPRDIVPEAVLPLLEKQLPGFGELFRFLSFQEIGSAAMMSRAFAGTAKKKLVFCLPGSPHACRLAMERLILPELRHLLWTVQGQRSRG
ncbi:MAG: MogA/MoaB family molybdenum cofactor biosynthesis protein [Armatimonadetes bacterium]|nr:MogA/MoaB family molybdenum cofactor biosynthesis protein [Armatimonadota bacterium]MDW8123012.1 MogA/MoaB family molybdenum cofactor biosynthesis protein [Armatimonadota bacterium]